MFKTKVFVAKTMAKKFYGDAMKSMKELSGKSITKAKGLKNKVVAKHAKIASDYGVRKGSFAKDFAIFFSMSRSSQLSISDAIF